MRLVIPDARLARWLTSNPCLDALGRYGRFIPVYTTEMPLILPWPIVPGAEQR